MKKRGFTIIEVVLVLAIAGLIFLMVFIALPALQRSQRNTRRRQDISRISTAVTDYISQNNKLPFSQTGRGWFDADYGFVSRYIDEDVVAVSGNTGRATWGNSSDKANKHYVCKEGSDCSQFTDPDGEIYDFYFGSSYAGVSPKLIDENYDIHDIYVASNASCDDSGKTSGEIDTSRYGSNSFALFYILEGGAVYCVDNS